MFPPAPDSIDIVLYVPSCRPFDYPSGRTGDGNQLLSSTVKMLVEVGLKLLKVVVQMKVLHKADPSFNAL
jgi:hypothetical protein